MQKEQWSEVKKKGGRSEESKKEKTNGEKEKEKYLKKQRRGLVREMKKIMELGLV